MIFSVQTPPALADSVQAALEAVLRLAEQAGKEQSYTIEETFPDLGPGDALRGARELNGLTQQQLAEAVGVGKSNISEMERGKRPIGKAMAKRLAKALGTSYKVFL
ncbi:MAG: helix-turn-helix transcriptional regulator [Thermodesulfobacteriota bacterium]